MTLPQIRQDLANHFIYGSVVSVFGAFFGPFGAVGAAATLGVAKEIVDHVFKTGVFDPLDIVATTAGGLPVELARFVL